VSVEQIASETGAPVGTVKARLHRGRAALAKHLVVDEVDETDAPARKESRRVG
jgi:RNA polymerase sigma-70 factor (ECF subfamily)